jgi:hypothetical protein
LETDSLTNDAREKRLEWTVGQEWNKNMRKSLLDIRLGNKSSVIFA